MSKSILLSPKHGVNPSVGICAFCGHDKEVLLMGKLKNDAEAPSSVISDYQPCD